jgi:hypothetical protein
MKNHQLVTFLSAYQALYSLILICYSCFLLCGCITEWESKDTDGIEGILVVEGIIIDDESVITLSRSKELSYEDNIFDLSPYHVTDAKVYIECDDGTQWGVARQNSGQYTIETGKLNPARQYRLIIVMKETDKTYEYQSEFASPMVTPEIDSVFWTQKEKEQPVYIHVATHAPDDMVRYFRWSYSEDWEIKAQIPMPNADDPIPFFCSKKSKSREMLIGTTERSASGQLVDIITEIPPRNDRLTVLYRMDVTQQAISKQAFDYFTNVKKNSRKTGSLFAHVPAELKGNIICTTDPGRVVIGYVDVSSSARKVMYIHGLGVDEDMNCGLWTAYDLRQKFGPNIPDEYQYYSEPANYVLRRCVNCAENGGRSIFELEDWPNQYTKMDWYIEYFENLQ